MQMPPTGDEPFQHYTLKHRVIAWISQNLFDGFTYTVRRGLLQGMKRKGGLAWLPSWGDASPSAEELFWRELDLTNQIVFDVGAFHGLLTLHMARQASQVICYEPNPRNAARLLENLALNHIRNVSLRRFGVSDSPGELELVADPLMPGGGTIQSEGASAIRARGGPIQRETITLVTLDNEVALGHAPPPNFIKIDIEGAELLALQGASKILREYQPALFLEMHGETMNLKRKAVAAIVDFLLAHGYSRIRHLESGQEITAQNSAVAAEGHLYCTSPEASLPR